MTKRKDIMTLGRQIDSSYAKLKWNVQGIFDKINILQSELTVRLKEVPLEKINERKKIVRWQEQLNDMSQKVEHVREIKTNRLEEALNYKFVTPDLLILAFVQPSIRNTFKELKKFFTDVGSFPIKESEFDDFIHMGDASRVLALIGDAAIDLALVHILWDPNISKVGDLHEIRANFVSNKNLARICDKWNLFESRIHLDPIAPGAMDETISHTKGTIIESIFGVIYIESGLEPVISSITILK